MNPNMASTGLLFDDPVEDPLPALRQLLRRQPHASSAYARRPGIDSHPLPRLCHYPIPTHANEPTEGPHNRQRTDTYANTNH